MAYLAPIHRPSSVRHALKLNLLDPLEECLVLAKANRIEIWTLSTDGLVMVHSKAIYGRITMLEKIRPFGAKTDHLFIGTLRFQYFTVVWNPETRTFDTAESFVDLSERHLKDSQSRDRCLRDPTGQYLVMELFQGILNLVKLVKPRKGRDSYLDEPEQVRITEMKVRASTFLYTEMNRPKLAILYDAGKIHADLRLATYRVVDERLQWSTFDTNKHRENDIGDLDVGASHLIPVPKGQEEQKRYVVRNATAAKAQLGGLIIVGETRMTYLDDESKVTLDHQLEEANVWVAWEMFDGLRYLLADNYARLYVLTLEVDGAVVVGMNVRLIGRTTKATVMVHMGDGIVFIASHEGDSQVVRLDLDSGQPQMEILQTMANVAPIFDFAVMDMGGRDGETQTNEYSSGQARLVTGSGAWEEGSLRSVRSGVGLEDVGILADLPDIAGLFALCSSERTPWNDVLVISLPIQTRVLKFDSQGEIEELVEFRGCAFDAPTLLAINVKNDFILQVTNEAAILLSPTGVSARWKPPGGEVITAASANKEHLLLASNGTTLVTLDMMLNEIQVKPLGATDQIACIHVPIHIPNIAVVGFWSSGSISILDLRTLDILSSEDLRRADSASVPRDIAITQILPTDSSGLTLFVAMEDGIVLTFAVGKNDFSLSGRKSIVLGTQQAKFEILPRNDGLFNVFATCEHPSLIYGSEGRIVYSAVTAESATHICSFNSEVYPDSIVVATADSLKISQIDTERRTHVKTLPMGETVRRIAYSPNERAFGLGCMKRTLVEGEEVVSSSFRLVEEVMFGEMGLPFYIDSQDGSGDKAAFDTVTPELIECVIRAELPTTYGDGQPVERFIVGTSYLSETAATTNVGGRILVVGVNSSRSPYLITSLELKGACRCLAILDGKIVAALVKTVVMFAYTETTSTHASLQKLATYRTSTCPIALDVTGNIIAVGDMMKSTSLVEYRPGTGGLPDTLQEVARHMQSCWTTAVCNIDPDSYLEADHHGNLLVLQRNREGVTLEDRKRLTVTSELNMGEQVNKLAPIQIEPSATAMVIPKAFLATTEGSIYLFSTITPSSQDLLIRLQERMATHLHTLGDLDFHTYRAYKLEHEEHEEPFRFVDGELVERFLDCDEGTQEAIAEGLGPSVEDLRGVVEELRRLH